MRPKRDVPSVGFCGFVGTPLRRLAYRLMRRQRKAAGLTLRARLLRGLRRPGIDARFITRSGYWAGTMSRFKQDHAAQFPARAEFLRNVLDTDYTLCVRGAGNFSYRLYEVLSAGRIPLFVDTRCVLPFPDHIDWRQHCVWVGQDQISSIGQILINFHRGVSAERFEQMQRDNPAAVVGLPVAGRVLPHGAGRRGGPAAAGRGRPRLKTEPGRVAPRPAEPASRGGPVGSPRRPRQTRAARAPGRRGPALLIRLDGATFTDRR